MKVFRQLAGILTLLAAASASNAAPLLFSSLDINQALTSENTSVVRTFTLPDITALDSISIDLAHTWSGDLRISLTAPNADVFSLVNETYAGGALGLNTFGGLVAPYVFQESGNMAAWGPLVGGIRAHTNGPFTALTWGSGSYLAGDWTLSILDTWSSSDNGWVGSATLFYVGSGSDVGTGTVPEPGLLFLLAAGLFALTVSRRRRPYKVTVL